jgi:hypothetical protein
MTIMRPNPILVVGIRSVALHPSLSDDFPYLMLSACLDSHSIRNAKDDHAVLKGLLTRASNPLWTITLTDWGKRAK